MQLSSTAQILRTEVVDALLMQGYTIADNTFYLETSDKTEIRNLHSRARAERINRCIRFMESFAPKAKSFMRDTSEVQIDKIMPRLIEIRANSIHENLFRWWNLAWWSLPYEKAYGRQMRFIVWDDYHDAPIGLIGLQSPILCWNVRDKHLGITRDERDYWVNQSMSAQRLGALPPYNKFLGGKLIALLLTSNDIRVRFQKKYEGYETLLMQRNIPANLLFITTTGAYGKSSVYNRLRFNGSRVCDFIGYSQGSGSFHIPDTLYEDLVRYLEQSGMKAGRAFGSGPSAKIKNIDQAMRQLGFKKGNSHGVKRAVYLFPCAKNISAVIQRDETPVWENRNIEELTRYWKTRWAIKRSHDYPQDKLKFTKEEFLCTMKQDLETCRELFNGSLL